MTVRCVFFSEAILACGVRLHQIGERAFIPRRPAVVAIVISWRPGGIVYM